MIHIILYFNFLGTIGLVDYDVVDLSNLQRQILHTEEKVGVAKVDSAIDFLKRFFIPSLNS